MLKSKVKILSVFIISSLILVTYALRLKYSLWYDEAAVVENAKNLSFPELNKGLNWLQTIPPGYFALVKFFVQFSYGVEILRFISSCSFLLGTLVLVLKLLPPETKFLYKLLLGFVLLGNPISITYATMVKPYALEYLLSVIALYCVKTSNVRALIALGVIGPVISNSTVIFYAAVAIYVFFKSKKIKWLLSMATASGLSTLFSLYLTASGTREMMKTVWFGSIDEIGFQSFKSAIGNLGWLPVSGLGLLPERGSNSLHLYSSICVLGILLIFACWSRSDYKAILCIAIGLAIIGQTLLLMPAAGRLMLGVSGLIWFLTFSFASKLKPKMGIAVAVTIFALVMVSSQISNVWLNPVASSHIKEIIKPISDQRISGKVYTNLWAGPATRYYLGSSKDLQNSNLIWSDQKATLSACWPTVLRKGDLISLDFVSETVLSQIGSNYSLKPIQISFNSGLFEVVKDLPLQGLDEPELNLSCMYSWSNPQFPKKDSLNVR